ncbi:tripartite tricarboxylate transporter TctB family protein [Castellaniella sp. WN]
MKVRNKQDFWSGVMFLAIGLGLAATSSHYAMGSAARMGPGYFPFWLGLLLAALGLAISAKSLDPHAEKTEVEGFDLFILGIIIGSVVLFGILLDFLGVYLSVFLLVVVSSLASHVFSWKISVLNGVCMTLFVWLAFVKGLGIIFPLWPGFLNLS